MNRRAFAKALGMWAAVALVRPKGDEMPQIGDLFVKLGRGETLMPGELETLRLEMNRLQSGVSRLDTVMAPTGGLDANVFRNSGGFSILPHEAASIFNGGEQTIPTTSWTTLVGDATSGATWSRGFRIDAATGLIYVTGVQRETILLIHAHVYWKPDMHGQKVSFKWLADDTSSLWEDDYIPAGITADNWRVEFDHVRSLPSTQTNYRIQVAQYSGGDQVTCGFLFTVVRLR